MGIRRATLALLLLPACFTWPTESRDGWKGSFRAELSDLQGANTSASPLEAAAIEGSWFFDPSLGGFLAYDRESRDGRYLSVGFTAMPVSGKTYRLARAPGADTANAEFWDSTPFGSSASPRYWQATGGTVRITGSVESGPHLFIDLEVVEAVFEEAEGSAAQPGTTGTFQVDAVGHRIPLVLMR